MDTIKRFFKYAMWIILFYILSSILINVALNGRFKVINKYTIETQSPIIQVTEFKSSYTNGYIYGNVTNDTGVHINKCYLRVDLYNGKNHLLGTRYYDLNYFNVNEKINFDIEYNLTAVESAKFSITEEKIEDDTIGITINDEYKGYEKLWIIIGVPVFLYYAPIIWFGL